MGNLDAKRDWGHAKDYVRMMWMILQADEPEDWVIATGITTTVRDFVSMAFGYCGIELDFTGEGVNEIGRIKALNEERLKELGLNIERLTLNTIVVAVDPRYF